MIFVKAQFKKIWKKKEINLVNVSTYTFSKYMVKIADYDVSNISRQLNKKDF